MKKKKGPNLTSIVRIVTWNIKWMHMHNKSIKGPFILFTTTVHMTNKTADLPHNAQASA